MYEKLEIKLSSYRAFLLDLLRFCRIFPRWSRRRLESVEEGLKYYNGGPRRATAFLGTLSRRGETS
jgi:hypothetical protein